MIGTLSIRNRQRLRRINTRLLRRITLRVLREKTGVRDFELGVQLVEAAEMTRINHTFLQHDGSTDVITFDYNDLAAEDVSKIDPAVETAVSHAPPSLHGDIFICLDDAVRQAREFRTTWQTELVRYTIHGLLHLCGHDDLKPTARRIMKREEMRLLRKSAKEFPLAQLGSRQVKRRTARSVS